jgi:hypothetical protein
MAKRCARWPLIWSVMLPAIFDGAIAADTKPTASPAAAPSPYEPGLGDFMTAYVQPHHAKLWFAGSAGNWVLATYEADELSETFDDIVSYQGILKDKPVARLVGTLIKPAMTKVDAAIAAKDRAAFNTAYTALTAACNACHTATQHGFIRIKIPVNNPFGDQEFNNSN